jgi:WD40 repeat protein
VASAGNDGTVRLWPADGSGEPLILRGHEYVVFTASFNPDGSRVVRAGRDGTIPLSRTDNTGEPLILRGHAGSVYSASFSPDGTRVVSAGQDGTVRVWHVFASEHALIDAARASLPPRQLTVAQRARYHLPRHGV